MLNPGELVIDDGNAKNFLSGHEFADLNGDFHRGYGLVPRAQDPDATKIVPMKAVQMDLIDPSDYDGMLEKQAATKTRLSDMWFQRGLKCLDQGQVGYCWGHGTVHSVMIMRALRNMPKVALSAFGICAPLVNGADQGGWGGWSLEYAMKVGIPSQTFWPQGSRDMRLDTTACRENAALQRVTGSWMDLSEPKYDRDLTLQQMYTLLLNNIPVVVDLMWWGHCVVALDMVKVSAGQYGIRIMNSWSETWGDRGLAVLTGSKGVPDNSVAPGNLLAA